MDPDANLREQRELAQNIQTAWDRDDEPPEFDPTDVARLAELVIALDGWICKGGFLPERWAKNQ